MFDPDGSGGEVGSVPVFSAGGEALAHFGTSEALNLLRSGMAVACWGDGETFYLRLKFDHESSIKVSESVKPVSLKDSMDVWNLIPPKREYVKKLVEVAKSNRRCLRMVGRDGWKYVEALLLAEWDEIRSPAVLRPLSSIVKSILKGLAEPGVKAIEGSRVNGEMAVWSLVGADSASLMRLIRRAKEAYGRLSSSIRARLGLSDVEKSLLRALEGAFKRGLLKRIRSPMLLRALAPIVRKLLAVVGENFHLPRVFRWEELGVDVGLVRGAISLRLASAFQFVKRVAANISRIAQSWGNRAAHTWSEDEALIKYLMMTISHRENWLYAMQM